MFLLSQTAFADPIIPSAIDWSTTVTDVTVRNGGISNTSVTDVTGGVMLHFDEASGGSGIGTDTRYYDFTTTAAASGGTVTLDFNIDYNTFLGFAVEYFGLQV